MDKSEIDYENWLRIQKNSNDNKYVKFKIQVNQNKLDAVKMMPIFELDRNKEG